MELLAGGHCAGPRRSVAALVAQLRYPLQRGVKLLANRQATLLQGGAANRCFHVVMPVAKQVLLKAQELGSEFSTGARGFRDGDEIADQVRPAQMLLLQVEMVVGRKAIAHDDPAQGAPRQLDSGG